MIFGIKQTAGVVGAFCVLSMFLNRQNKICSSKLFDKNLFYRVDPEVCAETDVKADGEEEAGVPVDQDQD